MSEHRNRVQGGQSQIIGLDGAPIQTLNYHERIAQDVLAGKDKTRARAPKFDEERVYLENKIRRLGMIDVAFLFNDILVVQYEREKVSEHLVAPADTQRADYYEGVVGGVLIVGPTAFQDDTITKFPWDAWISMGLVKKHGESPVKPGDWVLYRATDGWNKHVQFSGEYDVCHCRVLNDAHIRGIVKYPGRWW